MRLYHGDAVGMLARHIGDDSVDLTVTSPPYDGVRSYGGFTLDIPALIDQLHRVTKPGGVVVWVVADQTVKGSETGTSMRHALAFMDAGFRLHDTMIYHKDNPPPVGGSNRYYQSWEYMFVLTKGTPATFNPLTRPQRNKWNDKRTHRVRPVSRGVDGEWAEPKLVPIKTEVKRSNVWSYVVSGGSVASDPLAHEHPAIFPEMLVHDHVVSWTNAGDVVLDPMMGSGTTPKVVHALGREAVGIELNDDYFALAQRRVTEPFVVRQDAPQLLPSDDHRHTGRYVRHE